MNIIEKLNSIKKQELTAQENLKNYLKTINEKNGSINAFVYIN